MEQHPVPQQISSYEFRLVGDMTLRQFFQVGGGCVIALIFYASRLPWYLKWPFVFLFALLGVAAAFLPLEERPLQTWILAFFKAVYSPTQYLWRKKPKTPEFLEKRPSIPKAAPPARVPADRTKLTEYLETLPVPKSPLDQKEEGFVNQIQNLFSLTSLPPSVAPEVKPLPEEEKPAGIKIRKLRGPFVVEVEGKVPTEMPRIEEVPQVAPMPKISPLTKPIREKKPTTPAKFFPEIPMPEPPSIPNILVGMVFDQEGKIVENAIMEIRDNEGNPVRALKTSKLGQFRIATPLANGTYEIETEKEGLKFDIVKVSLTGEVIQPIEIHAH